ncbi:hypothetical protein BN961_01755 [Afipia felis]|uniref:Uncharacterized protein n=1 Tax=Afipia felis TaxID=1035 RepID=A0A090MLS9_AFIFE|nr:hypothetical protein BN961_01755 [Afipia felis]
MLNADVFRVLGGGLADRRIRTHGQRVHGQAGFGGPFLERLRQERNRGDQKEDAARCLLACVGSVGFGDFQRGKGLARTAGHDELAALGFFQACQHILDGFFLMLARLPLFAQLHLVGARQAELAPIDRAVFQVLQADANARHTLVVKQRLGVL